MESISSCLLVPRKDLRRPGITRQNWGFSSDFTLFARISVLQERAYKKEIMSRFLCKFSNLRPRPVEWVSFWMETRHPTMANYSRSFPAFLHTYWASGVFKNTGQGRAIPKVHGPHLGMGATGIQGLNKITDAQSFLGPPKFFRRASTPAL